ncbi:MAG: AraC family transcriptional regulator [Moheibacter sp.]
MKFFWLVLFVLIGFNLYAQDNGLNIENQVRELKNLGNQNGKDEKDIARMFTISKQIYSREPDFVLACLNELKPLIEEKNYYEGWRDYCFLIKEIYKGKGELPRAEKIISQIYTRHSKNFTPLQEVSVRFNLVEITHELGETERSMEIISELLPKAQTAVQKAALYFQQASNYTKKEKYKQAIEGYLKAIDLYKSIEDWKNLSIVYDSLGALYWKMKNYEKAFYYSRKSLALAKNSGNYLSEIGIYSNLGVYHNALKQTDSALYYYKLSIALAKKHNSLPAVAQNLTNMANIYSGKGNYSEAEKYYKQSLNICYSAGIQYGIYLNWFNLSSNYQLQKEYSKAKSGYDSAFVWAHKLKMPSKEMGVQEGYYKLYQETRDFEKALSHYEKFNEIKQLINLEESKKQVAEIQAKYDVAVKDKEIEQINSEYKVQKFRNNMLILAIAFVLLGTGSVIYFLIYRNKSLRKLYERNVELAQSPFVFELSEQEEEKAETANPMKRIFEKLVHLMETEKTYKEPNLTVNNIAKQIQTNRNYLSNSITTYANTNFNNFINSYRIREAKRMILQNPDLTLNEVMYTCGFNSRTPFYMAFQKFTGMSPQQFKDLSGSKKSKDPIEENIQKV